MTTAQERFIWTAGDIDVTKKDGEDITAAASGSTTGGMIALVPSEADLDRLVLESGESREQLHLTLLFLGDVAEIPATAVETLRAECETLAGQRDVVIGNAFAASMFNPTGEDPCWVLTCSGDELAEQHLAAIAAGSAASVDGWSYPEQHNPWVAHITLAYTDDVSIADDVVSRVGDVTFDRLRLALADEVIDFPFGGTTMKDDETEAVQADASSTHSLSETSTYSVLHQRFIGLALERQAIRQDGGWTDMPADQVAACIDELFTDYEVSRSETGRGWQAWFASRDDVIAWAELDSDGTWSVIAAGPERNAVVRLTNGFKVALPAAVNEDDGQIAVQFWAMGTMGPMSYGRRLAASNWDDVQVNYGTKLGANLDELMRMKPPDDGAGRLMVWHGPPGTGKTHALRALAHEWRDWCDVDYIIDADAFFEQASYMVSALVMGNEVTPEERWRLVVIEDAGRYLLTDAQDKIGEGLGRLLNLADGLVGQGLRQLILMTTNEPVEKLHPAVTRPGRCLANMRFGPLTKSDANAWLAAHEIKKQVKTGATLAELYALSGVEAVEAGFGLPFGIMSTKQLTASETVTEPDLVFSTARIRAATLLDLPAFVEARLELTGPPDENGLAPWAGVLTVEGVPTGDGRLYQNGCFRWEDPGDGWALRWDIEDDGMHLGAVRVGRIDTMERDGDFIRGTGVIDTNTTWGMAAYGLMERKMLSGVSVDMDDIPEESVEVSDRLLAAACGSDELPLAPEGTTWEPGEAQARILELADGDVSIVAMGHLFVPDDADPADPASYQVPFADVIEGTLTAVPAGVDWAAETVASMDIPEEDLTRINDVLGEYFERMVETEEDEDVEVVDDELEASAWTQFRELPELPAAMFAEPELEDTDEYVHYENGRIYGWVAQAGVCHDGISGKCVTPPLGRVDLSTFLRQPIKLDDGSTARVGVFTMGTGHHNDGANADSIRALFDDTRTVAGVVTVGVKKDERGHDRGMWFSGVAAPWLSDWDRTVLAACRPSGHWRRLRSGGWSLRAVLSVPTPGFPNRVSGLAASAVVNRSNMALAASAVIPLDETAKVTALHEGEEEYVKLIAGAIVDELEERQRIRAEVEELSASLNDVRRDLAASFLRD